MIKVTVNRNKVWDIVPDNNYKNNYDVYMDPDDFKEFIDTLDITNVHTIAIEHNVESIPEIQDEVE